MGQFMRIVASFQEEHRRKTKCVLTWSYPRLDHVNSPTQSSPTENEILSRFPPADMRHSTQKQNCCSSAFVVMSQGGNQLYPIWLIPLYSEDVSDPYQFGMCSEKSFFHPWRLTCVVLSFCARACVFKTAGQGLGCSQQMWCSQGTSPAREELLLST